MGFDSAFFIFFFLSALLIVHLLIRGRRGRNILLLAAGLLFYSFGQLSGVLLLLAMALMNYLFGLLILRGVHKKACMIAAVALTLVFLAVFKYLDFFLSSITPALGSTFTAAGLIAPVGISFFSFKCISYVVDAYRDPSKATRNFADLLLYVSFFPQIMAGPITRFAEFRPQLITRNMGIIHIAPGLRRFIIGLTKKLVFASAMGGIVDVVFALDASALDFRLAWLGAVAYTLQIFFDFSGYSDMAIGLGEAFGFRTPENFNYPYASVSISDFWRRWHMTLSTWFRDYLYIPLGGNRRGAARTAWNKLIVFTLCGLWHGAAWTFILWGLWHGVFTALESIKMINTDKLRRTLAGRAVSHVYTMFVVIMGFVMFRAETVQAGANILGAIFNISSYHTAAMVTLHSIVNAETVLIFIIGVFLCIPLSKKVAEKLFCRNGVLRSSAQAASYVLVVPFSCGAFLRLLSVAFRRLSTSSFEVDSMTKTAIVFIFVSVFLLISLVPGVGILLAGPSKAGANEIQSKPPALLTADGQLNREVLSDISNYVSDHFYLRQDMITLHNQIITKLFAVSPADDVILGSDDWLYYAQTLDDYTGAAMMTTRELYSSAVNLRLMQEYCRTRGMKFLFTIAPNKNSIYADNMPNFGAVADIHDAQRLLRLLEENGVSSVDLFEIFSGQDEVLYFTHDSHWNARELHWRPIPLMRLSD